MQVCRRPLAWLASLCAIIAATNASPYDPHLSGPTPWFEGWYTRVVDSGSDLSFGAVTGYFPDQVLTEPSYFAGLLFASSQANSTRAYRHLPPGIAITGSDGRPVHKQPAKLGSPDFALHTADSTCNLTINGTAFAMAVTAENVTLTIQSNAPGMPWGPGGEGPEGVSPCSSLSCICVLTNNIIICITTSSIQLACTC